MWLVKLSVERPILISMVNLFMLVLGIIAFMRLGVDQFPKIEPPVITITTEYPGAGPAEIESLVSSPIEEEVNQLSGIERLVSTSRDSISQVVVEFKLEVNAKDAIQNVRDKVSRAKARLPEEVDEPLVERLDFSDRPIALLALTKHKEDLSIKSELREARLRYFAEERLKPLLQTIDGVGRIEVAGGLEREIVVEMNLQKVMALNLSPEEIRQALLKSNLNVPSGNLEEEPRSRSIRVLGEYQSLADIRASVVKELKGGRIVQIKDVADVRDSFKDRDSLARLNGVNVILVEVRKQTDANLVRVSDNLKNRLGDTKGLTGDEYKLDLVYDGSRSIRNTLYDVVETLVIAAVLAVLVVYFFLGSLQSTLITGLALPTSIIGTFLALYLFDYTLNIMTLLGITLSVGLILDDAIVVRENIWAKLEAGFDPKTAALEGTRQVYTAVLATSLTILAVFVPVMFIPGIVGKFFAAFAVTVCFGVIFSTFDAITMAPMLSAYLVSRHQKESPKPVKFKALKSTIESINNSAHASYQRFLTLALSHPGKVLLISVAIFFVSIYLGKYVGFTFLPQDESGEIEVAIEAPAGTTPQHMGDIVKEIEVVAQGRDDVKTVTSRVGNTFGDTNVATVFVTLVPNGERDLKTSEVMSLLQKSLQGLFSAERLTGSVRPGGGGNRGKALSLVVQGADNEKLYVLGNKLVEDLVRSVPQLRNVSVNLRRGREEIQLVVNREAMAQLGVTAKDVGEALRGMFAGKESGKYREMGSEFDIRTRLRMEDRFDRSLITQVSVPNSRGESVLISDVAKEVLNYGPSKIIRINQNRSALIEADLQPGAPLADVLGKVKAIVEPQLPPGYRMEFQGQAKSLADLQAGAIVAIFLGALFIYMIMASLYESLLVPLAILLTMPLAIVGAVVALLIAQKNLDIYGIIGMILLMGLVTKNAILLVDYVEQLRKEGLTCFEALYQGSSRRVRPILMTTIAMVAGMLPVAIGLGEVNKIRSAMGIAAIGGMLSSTLLSLIVVPCFYVFIDRLRVWLASRQHKPAVQSVVP